MGLFLRGEPTPPPVLEPEIDQRNRAKAAPYGATRAITASAERVDLKSMTLTQRPYSAWQQEAWVGYERVGEIHFGFNLLANLLSRVRIYCAALGKSNEAPVDLALPAGKDRVDSKLADAARAAMAELQHTDFSNLIRAFSLNFSVPGECYLIKLPTSTGATWSIRSTDEVQVRVGGIYLVPMRNSAAEAVRIPDGTYVARLWRQNPRYSREPDSSMVGVADSVEELLMLQRLVRSATRSRLNAGMLFVPEGIVSAQTGTKTGDPVIEETTDPLAALAAQSVEDPSGRFLSDLMESMTTPISDEGSASAVVPMLVMGPGELGQQIQHITFERATDQWLVDRIEKVMNRILQGIDMPKEIVTGLQHVRYSNAVVIDEGLYKANIEPLALAFVDALTDVYLRPVLKAAGFAPEDLVKIAVWYDPSEIVTRPNKEDEATQGTDRLLLSPAAWRREHGYPESDAPTEEDIAVVMLQKLTVMPPAAAMALLKHALPKVMADVEQVPATPDPAAPNATDSPNVIQMPQPHPANPTADAQRTAVQQVGLK